MGATTCTHLETACQLELGRASIHTSRGTRDPSLPSQAAVESIYTKGSVRQSDVPLVPVPHAAFAQEDALPTASSRAALEHVLGLAGRARKFCGAPTPPETKDLLLSRNAELGASGAEIPAWEVRRGSKIGSGAWSVVYAGEWRQCKVAIKVFRAADTAQETEEQWKMFLKEVAVLQQLDSPRLVKLLGAFVNSEGCPCLVTELLEGGTLHEFLHGRRKSHKVALEPAHRFLLALHITQGIAYLHSCSPPIIHRDLKSKNVVVLTMSGDAGPPHAATIIDYGLAECLATAGATHRTLPGSSKMQGSAGYMAPECFSAPIRLSPKADVWALGCVLAEVFGGAPPHTECEDLPQVIAKVLVQRQPPDVPRHADLAGGVHDDDAIQHLLSSCFKFDMTERPAATQVFEILQQLAVERGFDPVPL